MKGRNKNMGRGNEGNCRHKQQGGEMKRKHCQRPEIKGCPYRAEDFDAIEHLYGQGVSLKESKKGATGICRSIPCLFLIEILLLREEK